MQAIISFKSRASREKEPQANSVLQEWEDEQPIEKVK